MKPLTHQLCISILVFSIYSYSDPEFSQPKQMVREIHEAPKQTRMEAGNKAGSDPLPAI